MKKRKLNKKLVRLIFDAGIIAGLLIVFLLIDLFLINNIHFFGVRSVNDNAKSYKTKSCLAFYPNTKDGKKIAEGLCDKTDSESIYDYALVPYGDYYLVEYGNNVHYYIDKNNNPLTITTVSESGKNVLSDYLRYNMKKDEIDKAYSLSFIQETSLEKLDISNCKYNVDGENLLVYYPQFDYTSKVPLKYIQDAANINLNYSQDKYTRPKYISRDRKIVAFTFDDGPKLSVSSQIIDTLYQNDANATFFILGNRLEQESVNLIEKSIKNGNEYGSHTQSHPYLRLISLDEEYDEIMKPVLELKNGSHEGTAYDFDGIDYDMKYYRAPYGEHRKKEETKSPLMSIEWDCDSKDWEYRDAEQIIESVNTFKDKNPGGLDGCIVLFHDTYQETADAIKTLIPGLIEEGYQFVTIDELLNFLDIDKTRKYYPW